MRELDGGTRLELEGDLLAHLLREQANVLVEIVRQSAQRVGAMEDRRGSRE